MEHTRESLEDILALLDGVKGPDSKGNYAAICPAHDDTRPSLSVTAGREQPWVATCHAGCAQADVLAAIRSLAGSTKIAPKAKPAAKKAAKIEPQPARRFTSIDGILLMTRGKATPYIYRDASGVERGMVLRVDGPDGKRISQWRKDPDGLWSPGSLDKPRLLYNLPEIANRKPGSTVYVVEGEKCAERLIAEGLCATTASGGAVGASHADWSPLVGMEVIVVPDEDEAGAKYAITAVKELERLGHKLPIRIVSLPGLEPDSGQDIADWLLIPGNTAEKFCDLVDASPAISMVPVGPTPDPEGDAEREAIRDEGCTETPEDAKRRALLEAVAKQATLRAQVLKAVELGLKPSDAPLWASRDKTKTVTGQPRYTRETLETLPPVKWIVPNVIPCGQLGILYGPPATGKSLLLLSMANAIVNGRLWFGHHVAPGPVLIYAGESPSGWATRSRALRRKLGQPLVDAHPLTFVGGCPGLDDLPMRVAEIELEIQTQIEEHGRAPALVVIDTLSVALNGLSENDAKDIAPVLRDLRILVDRYGCTVLLIHHPGKAQPGQPATMRGSSAMLANVDFVLAHDMNADRVTTLECDKMKDGNPPDIIAMGRVLGWPLGEFGPDGRELTGAVLAEVTEEEADQIRVERDEDRKGDLRAAIHMVLSDPSMRITGTGAGGGVSGLLALVKQRHPDLPGTDKDLRQMILAMEGDHTIERDKRGNLCLAGDAEELDRAWLAKERERIRKELAGQYVTGVRELCRIIGCSTADHKQKVAQLGIGKVDGAYRVL